MHFFSNGAGIFILSLVAFLSNSAAVAQQRRDTVPALRADSIPILKGTNKDTLKEIRVLGQRPLVEKKLDRTVVHIDALLANAGGQAWNVLENTPGVTVDEDGGIMLNGKSGVLLLIDDRPLYLEGPALVSFLKGLPASGLEQVELLPTPPARYPAAGAAGIIIIRTRKAAGKGFSGQLTSNFTQGVYPRANQSVQVSGQVGPWQVRAFGAYGYTRTFNNSVRYRHYLNPDGTVAAAVTQNFHEDSWQQTINYDVAVEHVFRQIAGAKNEGPCTTWGLEISGDANPYHEFGHYVDGYYTGAYQLDSLSNVHSSFHNNYTDIFGNAHVIRKMSHAGSSLSADFDIVHHHLHQQQQENTFTTYADTDAINLYQLATVNPATADIYGLKTDYTDRFGKTLFLESGVQATWSRLQNAGAYQDGVPGDISPDASLDNSFRYDEDIVAAYLTLRRVTKRLTAQAGLRMEHTLGNGQSSGNLDSSIHMDYANLFPSAHLQWDWDGNTRKILGLTYARRVDRPGFGELNPAPFFFDRYTYFSGNPTLTPEFSQNFELSFTYLNRFTLTASYSGVQGSINQVYVAQGHSLYYYAINMNKASTAGLSGDINTQFTPHWSISFHAEWMYKHYYAILPGYYLLNKTLPYFLCSGNTRYSFKRGWSAEVGGFYKSDVLLAQAVLRPVGRLNLSVRKKTGTRSTFTLTGNDVLRTWIVARYIYMPNAVAYFRNSFDRRNVSLTFSYSFGKKEIRVAEHTSGVETERSRL